MKDPHIGVRQHPNYDAKQQQRQPRESDFQVLIGAGTTRTRTTNS